MTSASHQSRRADRDRRDDRLGKSTLMDLLLGLLEPTEGTILIDGRPLDDSSRASWQSEIAHVPQAIYLTDDTLAANIAFGVPDAEIDQARVAQAAASAGIGEFIATLPDGFATKTGERGIRLSGGHASGSALTRLYKRAASWYRRGHVALDTARGRRDASIARGEGHTIV